MIPPLFHLTAKSKTDLPLSFQRNIERIRQLYPDHEVRIHDDADIEQFIKKNRPEYYSAVISKMPSYIMVVDTVRYIWMHEIGGIYADMDVMFRKRLEFESGVVLVEREWTYPLDPTITTSVHNCFFASDRGHAVWEDLLEGIARNVGSLQTPRAASRQYRGARLMRRGLRRLHLVRPLGQVVDPVFNVSGPNAISRIITDQSLVERYPNVQLLPASAIYQRSWSKRPPGEEYLVHETAGSWRT